MQTVQCNGRDDIELSRKIELDTEYLKKFNIWFDIKIFFFQFGKQLQGRMLSKENRDSGGELCLIKKLNH